MPFYSDHRSQASPQYFWIYKKKKRKEKKGIAEYTANCLLR